MEIERKYLIGTLPADYRTWPFRQIEQAYLSTDPTIRVRREDSQYYMTYKSKGLLVREEYNLPLTREAYEHLLSKADGIVLTKKRYLKPLAEAYAPDPVPAGLPSSLTIEMDVFGGAYEGLVLAEVEFPTEEAALSFVPPAWFGKDVTFTGEYSNSRLALSARQRCD